MKGKNYLDDWDGKFEDCFVDDDTTSMHNDSIADAMDEYLKKMVAEKIVKIKEEKRMKELKKDNGWKLDVTLRKDMENIFVHDIHPLVPDKLYMIKNLTTASDGTVLVDVYAPTSMELIRTKINIDIFHILPINKRYIWKIMKFDPFAQPKMNTNVMIIKAYYCVVNQNVVSISDNIEGSLDRTEIMTSDSSIFIDGKGDVYAVLESDKDKQDQIAKKIKSKIPSNLESMIMSASILNGSPYGSFPPMMGMNSQPLPMPGMNGYYNTTPQTIHWDDLFGAKSEDDGKSGDNTSIEDDLGFLNGDSNE